MTPLTLFRSLTFSGVNALTLLLYAALGAAFFLLPFELIRAHGYAALGGRRGAAADVGGAGGAVADRRAGWPRRSGRGRC